jgi:putative tributyrin esterase
MKLLVRLFAFSCLLLVAGCRSHAPLAPDHPRLTPTVRMADITIHSRILRRDMPVRIVVPAAVPRGAQLPVVYLLHGAGVDYRNWTDNSGIAAFAERGVILVMPEAGNSYYINDNRGYRYEDYFIKELIPEVHRLYPFATSDRERTAIVGISRGGFGAAVYGLRHPDLFSYVGGLSSAFDLAERHFRWRHPMDSLAYRRIFGPFGGRTRTTYDPYVLAANASPRTAPYFYLTCGLKDSLFPTSASFTAVLQQHNLPHEFHTLPGDHEWTVWSAQIPALEESLAAHLGLDSEASPAR